MLFYRFISENLSSYIDTKEHLAVSYDFKYATLIDRSAELAKNKLGTKILIVVKFKKMQLLQHLMVSLENTLNTILDVGVPHELCNTISICDSTVM